MKKRTSDNHIEFLQWPARSPHLSLIGNMWGVVARQFYEGVRQFQNTNELEVAIADVLPTTALQLCKKLVQSMCRFCISVSERNGAKMITRAVFSLKNEDPFHPVLLLLSPSIFLLSVDCRNARARRSLCP